MSKWFKVPLSNNSRNFYYFLRKYLFRVLKHTQGGKGFKGFDAEPIEAAVSESNFASIDLTSSNSFRFINTKEQRSTNMFKIAQLWIFVSNFKSLLTFSQKVTAGRILAN